MTIKGPVLVCTVSTSSQDHGSISVLTLLEVTFFLFDPCESSPGTATLLLNVFLKSHTLWKASNLFAQLSILYLQVSSSSPMNINYKYALTGLTALPARAQICMYRSFSASGISVLMLLACKSQHLDFQAASILIFFLFPSSHY